MNAPSSHRRGTARAPVLTAACAVPALLLGACSENSVVAGARSGVDGALDAPADDDAPDASVDTAPPDAPREAGCCDSGPCAPSPAGRWTSLRDAPRGRHDHACVWTGDAMLLWGGYEDEGFATAGFRFDLARDTWTSLSSGDSPTGRYLMATAWTGRELVVWGGQNAMDMRGEGARYDPATDRWRPIARADAPSARESPTAVWTGREVVVWGGSHGYGASAVQYANGGRYDPTEDAWRPVNPAGAPGPRYRHIAVWTQSEMIVWGGLVNRGGTGIYLDDGGRYDPALDRWRAINTTNAPSPRQHAAAVWTGAELVVWGGETASGPSGEGARYDPASDTWTAMSRCNAPSPRGGPRAVWTGSEVVVWGGTLATGAGAGDGAAWNPRTDTWRPLSATGAPSPRLGACAVWTGTAMVVFGGTSTSLARSMTGGEVYVP